MHRKTSLSFPMDFLEQLGRSIKCPKGQWWSIFRQRKVKNVIFMIKPQIRGLFLFPEGVSQAKLTVALRRREMSASACGSYLFLWKELGQEMTHLHLIIGFYFLILCHHPYKIWTKKLLGNEQWKVWNFCHCIKIIILGAILKRRHQ